MELGFDPLLSRLKPRSFFFSNDDAAPPRSNAAPNQTSYAVGMTQGSNATQSDAPPAQWNQAKIL
jgi:hypothetical protein